MAHSISRKELKKMDLAEEFFPVEALDERFYRHSHPPGAINVPPKAPGKAGELLSDRGAEIVVYCSGSR